MFYLSAEIESRCMYCPYEQSAQFIEAMYRAGHGSWEELEEYCLRLGRFREASYGCSEWVKQRLAGLAGIPAQHVNIERADLALAA